MRNRTRKMEDQVNQVFKEHGREAFQAFGVFLVAHLLIFIRPAFFVLLASGVWLTVGDSGLLAVASQGLLAFQLTPGSAGTLDGGMHGVFELLETPISEEPGVAAQICMAFLLFTRFWDILIVGFGMMFGAKVGAGMLAGQPRGEDVGMADPEPVEGDDAA